MPDIFRREYKQLPEENKVSINLIKEYADELLDEIEKTDSLNPDKRMIALAKTNLEQAVMWAIKAIT
jgi:hypothetical protein